MRASAKRPVCNCKRWAGPHVGPLVTPALKKAAAAAARGGLDKMEAGSHYNQSFNSFGGDIHCLAVCSQIQREPLWPAGFHISLKPLGHPPSVPLLTTPPLRPSPSCLSLLCLFLSLKWMLLRLSRPNVHTSRFLRFQPKAQTFSLELHWCQLKCGSFWFHVPCLKCIFWFTSSGVWVPPSLNRFKRITISPPICPF